MGQYRKTNELKHFGIKGMKWGVRRFETKGGNLTAAGKKRYDHYDYDGGDSKKKSYKKKNKKMK